jgi:hypothetical protein
MSLLVFMTLGLAAYAAALPIGGERPQLPVGKILSNEKKIEIEGRSLCCCC